ncbi:MULTISPECIES: hypothetical protein [Bacillus]|uniref:Small, acid-soluble spore protein gamma-type n=2 Tax=Bacillus TaxID=1386 RepID=A0ABV1S0E3_BACAB|nr:MULTISPECIES: hypothetical protein [Bacillus]ANT58237.1 hypothetical protein VP59_15915 [Bacillus pumilus]EMI14203.1 hypothetical protein C883_3298 [Bacillus stratosphericus LAMA 585]KML19861.1 hypothetical protein VL09_00115 [Bacillus stratosphericus]MBX7000934.1 hypothetical protein [Bacillus aerophilus]CVN07290.1 Uncharacterised protein [Streptococcus pneumoniae]
MSITPISLVTNAMQTSNKRQAGHTSNSFLTQAAQIVQGDHSPEERKALFQQLTLVQQGKDLELHVSKLKELEKEVQKEGSSSVTVNQHGDQVDISNEARSEFEQAEEQTSASSEANEIAAEEKGKDVQPNSQ